MPPQYDAVVIGGGFFGLSVGLELGRKGQKILILEANSETMTRASMMNQARVHAGYHYPRHINTALRSKLNLPRFAALYREAIEDNFTHYYAIAKDQSLVSARQFKMSMELMSSEKLKLAPSTIHRHFNLDRIEAVFQVHEPAFNALKLRELIEKEIQAVSNVELKTQAKFEEARREKSGDLVLEYQDFSDSQLKSISTRKVYNCTYANLTAAQSNAGLEPTPLQYELAELCLVEAHALFKSMAVTVMCGPYFSLMPFPMNPGKHSLSHVRWTPHYSWSGGPRVFEHRPRSNFEYMIRDASRYLPSLQEVQLSDSIFEIKALLPINEKNDGRPILFQKQYEGQWINVLGGKLDNIFDVFEELS